MNRRVFSQLLDRMEPELDVVVVVDGKILPAAVKVGYLVADGQIVADQPYDTKGAPDKVVLIEAQMETKYGQGRK